MAHITEREWKTYTFKVIVKSDYPAVIKHLEENFHRDEPVTVAVGNSDLQLKDVGRFARELLDAGLSIAAFETETWKLAAVSVTAIVRKNRGSEFQCESEEQATIFGFFNSALEGIDLFEKYGVDEYVDIVMASVDREFRGNGLATELFERTLKLLRQSGFKLVKSIFTSPYTRRVSVKFGFEDVSIKHFRELKNTKGEYICPNEDEGQYLAVTVLRL